MSGYLNAISTGLIIFGAVFVFILLFSFLLQYRRNNRIVLKETLAFLGFILYIEIAYFLVILPLPDINTFDPIVQPLLSYMQLIPFKFVNDIITYFEKYPFSLTRLIFSPPFYIRAFNLILLYPLGIFLKNYYKMSLKKIIIISFFTSLSFELLQLSGLLFIYPHPYRSFDVDDLIANTLGAFLGGVTSCWYTFIFQSKKNAYLKNSFKPTMFKQYVLLLNDLLLLYILNFITTRIIYWIFYFQLNLNRDSVDSLQRITTLAISIIYILIPLFTKKYQTLSMIISCVFLTTEHDYKIKRFLRSLFIFFPYLINMNQSQPHFLVTVLLVCSHGYYMIHLCIKRHQMHFIDQKLGYHLISQSELSTLEKSVEVSTLPY